MWFWKDAGRVNEQDEGTLLYIRSTEGDRLTFCMQGCTQIQNVYVLYVCNYICIMLKICTSYLNMRLQNLQILRCGVWIGQMLTYANEKWPLTCMLFWKKSWQ